jgi:hypothetical protein
VFGDRPVASRASRTAAEKQENHDIGAELGARTVRNDAIHS